MKEVSIGVELEGKSIAAVDEQDEGKGGGGGGAKRDGRGDGLVDDKSKLISSSLTQDKR